MHVASNLIHDQRESPSYYWIYSLFSFLNLMVQFMLHIICVCDSILCLLMSQCQKGRVQFLHKILVSISLMSHTSLGLLKLKEPCEHCLVLQLFLIIYISVLRVTFDNCEQNLVCWPIGSIKLVALLKHMNNLCWKDIWGRGFMQFMVLNLDYTDWYWLVFINLTRCRYSNI